MNKKTASYANQLGDIRVKALNELSNIFKTCGLDELYMTDLDEGESVVIIEDDIDDENTFTLDNIEYEKGHFTFSCSSSWNNANYNEDEISVEALCAVVDFIKEHAEELVSGVINFNGLFPEGSDFDEATDTLNEIAEILTGSKDSLHYCDSGIDDGLDENEDGDEYLMYESYDLLDTHIILYYGDNSRKIGCIEITD